MIAGKYLRTVRSLAQRARSYLNPSSVTEHKRCKPAILDLSLSDRNGSVGTGKRIC